MARAAEADLDSLRAGLRGAGLVPDPDVYAALRPEVGRRGRIRRDEMRHAVGKRRWRAAVASLGDGLAEDALIRVLGFGDVLTRFSVAPLALPPGAEDAVAALGARANLIVTFYDELVDRTIGGDPLPPGVLARLAAGRGPGLGAARPGPPRFLAAAVQGYFRDVRALPHVSRRPLVLSTLVRAIWRMHQAERASVERGRLASQSVLRRKAALPFVVMGLPAWLASPGFDRAVYRWHLVWLYRLGMFLGQIDDAADLVADLASGRANALAIGDSGGAEGVVDLGRAVLDVWRARTPGAGTGLPGEVRDALPLCAASWLGGRTSV